MTDSRQFLEIEFGSDRYDEACQLRNEILRRPLGLNLFDQDLSSENNSRHFAIIESDQVIAYVMITPEDHHIGKLRQMLVVKNYRGLGLGKQLVEQTEDVLRDEGFTRIKMSARVAAIGFYSKLGYQQVSEEFLDVGIPHVTMEKKLPEEFGK